MLAFQPAIFAVCLHDAQLLLIAVNSFLSQKFSHWLMFEFGACIVNKINFLVNEMGWCHLSKEVFFSLYLCLVLLLQSNDFSREPNLMKQLNAPTIEYLDRISSSLFNHKLFLISCANINFFRKLKYSDRVFLLIS